MPLRANRRPIPRPTAAARFGPARPAASGNLADLSRHEGDSDTAGHLNKRGTTSSWPRYLQVLRKGPKKPGSGSRARMADRAAWYSAQRARAAGRASAPRALIANKADRPGSITAARSATAFSTSLRLHAGQFLSKAGKLRTCWVRVSRGMSASIATTFPASPRAAQRMLVALGPLPVRSDRTRDGAEARCGGWAFIAARLSEMPLPFG